MTNDERICAIALTLCEGIGHINAKRLIDEVGSATLIMHCDCIYSSSLPNRCICRMGIWLSALRTYKLDL